MSIRQLREEQGFPGLTMRYEEGGAVQVFIYNERETRVSGGAMIDEIAAAIRQTEQDAANAVG